MLVRAGQTISYKYDAAQDALVAMPEIDWPFDVDGDDPQEVLARYGPKPLQLSCSASAMMMPSGPRT